MQQQLFHAQRILIKDISLLVRGDVHAIHENLRILDADERLLDAALPHAQGLHFRAVERDTALILLLYKIVMICLLVVGNQLHCLILCHYNSLSSSFSSGMSKSIVLRSLSVALTLTSIFCPSLYRISVACPTIS